MSDFNQELLANLGELADESVDNSGPTGDFVYVDISSIDRETKKIIDPKPLGLSQAPSRAKQILKVGDVLVSMTRPNLNAVALVPEHLDGAIGSTGFHVLRSRWLAPQFLLALVQTQSFIDAMSAVVQGALYPAVRPRDITAYSFSFETPAQQARIVAKLEELLSNLDAGVTELKAAQKKLNQYRHSLLKSAVEGALTAEWRVQQASTENGAQLLQRILTERRARWEAKQLAKFKEQGKAPPKDWQKKYPEPLQPDATDLAELPEGWVWASVDCLLSEIETGKSFKCVERPPTAEETGVVKVSAVSWGEYDEQESKTCMNDERVNQELLIKAGDFLFSRANTVQLVGACVIAKTVSLKVMLSDKILRLVLVQDALKPWLLYLLRSKIGRKQIELLATGNQESMKNIGQERLRSIAIPLGPKSEIDHAITLVEQELMLASQQMTANEFGLKQASAQRQNILRAAFAGQLVPQDPSDEPASVLLTRIRAERAERAKQPKVRKTKQQKEVASVVSKLIDVLAEAGDWMSAKEAFRRCGVADGALTDQVEALYAELRALDKAGRLAVEAVTDEQGRKLHDRLKLLAV